jgi:hypothetical protein
VTLRRGEHILAEPVRIRPEEMKLPGDIRGVVESKGVLGVKLPDTVKSPLADAVRDLPEGEPIWFQLGQPAGHLAAVPWEWHLSTILGKRPVLRSPYSPVRSLISESRREGRVKGQAAKR